MYISTECIILNTIPYSDSKNIVHCYSDKKGKVSFLQYKSKGKRKKSEPYFYPFAIMEVQFRDNEKRTLHSISNRQYADIHQSLLNNPFKRSFALFLAEFTQAVLHEEEANTQLFAYIKTFIQLLDEVKEGFRLFHLKYMIELSRYTGFFPDLDGDEHWELQQTFSGTQLGYLRALVQHPYYQLYALQWTNAIVSDLLDAIIRYYHLHYPDFRTPDSLQVFREF